MQLEWEEHFDEIVIPAWRDYLASENALSAIGDAAYAQPRPREVYTALRFGAAAVLSLHHFAETALRARAGFLPAQATTPDDVAAWLKPHCRNLRQTTKPADVDLLRDVADALKHGVLTRRLARRQVDAAGAVLVVPTAYGALPRAEGKIGGAAQVVILARGGARALSVVLQNVLDAWRTGIGRDLPPLESA
jgi:hypothetical protein